MLKDLALRYPRSACEALRQHLRIVSGESVSLSTVHRCLKRSSLAGKSAALVGKTKPTEQTLAWHAGYRDTVSQRSSSTLHFFDKSMFSSRDDAGRFMQWSVRGTPACAVEPAQQHFKYSVAALTSLRAGGPCLHWRVYENATLAADVAECFRDVLLHADVLQPGDTVFLDNAATHCGDTEPLLRAVLRLFHVDLVYLPPYTPELNPIDLVFTKAKYLLRYRISPALTRIAKVGAIVQALREVTHDDVADFYRHAGYNT